MCGTVASMSVMAITDSDRAQAVQAAIENADAGMSASKAAKTAAKPLGVTGRTVMRWAVKAGTPIATVSRDRTKTASEDLRLQYQAQREELKVRMAKLAHDLLDRCYQPHYDYVSAGASGPQRVEFDTPRSGDIKNYTTSVAILIDKCRLEEGKATERTESMTVSAVEAWLEEQEAALMDADT